jgi:hypothetical protein
MKSWLLLVAAGISLAAAEMPDCSLAPGWEQKGPRRVYEGDNLFEYMDGNSEGYFIYGFVKMDGVSCTKGGDTILIDVSEMADPESAYGILSANRDPSAKLEAIGMGGQVVPRKAIAAKGKYYLEIASEADKDNSALLRELITVLAGRISGGTNPPPQIGWFPKEGVVPPTPRLIPQSVMGIGALKRGYMAQYQDKSKAFVVQETSADAATAVLVKLHARFGDATDAKIADGGFTVTDKYLGKLAMARKGRYIVGYTNLPDGADAAGLTSALAAKLP